jgi:MFS family permease
MPIIDVTATDEMANDARVRSNVVRLAAAQALTGANSAVIFATGSIVGATLAPNISLATVPLSMYVLGLAAGTLPTGAISRAYGRRVAFIIGTGCGVLTGLLGSFAILHASFWLFCGATFLGGLYGSVSQSYRFAAADGASVAYRPKAVSWVMAGGVFAGCSARNSCNGRWMSGRPICSRSASWCRHWSRWWRWQCCPASTRQSLRLPICTAAVRCLRSHGSRASSRPRCAASSPIR